MPQSSKQSVIGEATRTPEAPNYTPPAAASATPVPVHCGELLLTGWAIKRDTILVEAGGLTGKVAVTIDGRRVIPEEILETKRDIDGWQPLTALVLPQDTLQVRGEAFPPGFEPPVHPGTPARFTFWCMLFPRMRGC